MCPPPCAATCAIAASTSAPTVAVVARVGRDARARSSNAAARTCRCAATCANATIVDEQPERVRLRVARDRATPRRRARHDRCARRPRRRSRLARLDESAKPLGGTATTVGSMACGEGTLGAMARPRGARTRADEVVRRLARPLSRRALRAEPPQRVRAARRDDPLGADDRRARQHGDAGAVREVSDARRSRARGSGRRRAAHHVDRVLPLEDEEHHRAWRRRSKTRYDGEVPTELDDLVTLPGVGRKTGNVVRSVWFDLPGLPVDTHVTRLSHRLKLTNETDPVKIELDLNGIVAPEERGQLSLRLIEHGRRVCDARRPRCDVCVLADICPSAGKVGVTASRRRTSSANEGMTTAPDAALPALVHGHLPSVCAGRWIANNRLSLRTQLRRRSAERPGSYVSRVANACARVASFCAFEVGARSARKSANSRTQRRQCGEVLARLLDLDLGKRTRDVDSRRHDLGVRGTFRLRHVFARFGHALHRRREPLTGRARSGISDRRVPRRGTRRPGRASDARPRARARR